MRDDLISRADAIDAVKKLHGGCITEHVKGFVEYTLLGIPSADRPMGEWMDNDCFVHKAYEYSNCGNIVSIKSFYCGECGARMKGGNE